MADQGRGRQGPVADAFGDTEASAADVAEQRHLIHDDADDAPAGFGVPIEASEADVVEQMLPVPLDDDDRR